MKKQLFRSTRAKLTAFIVVICMLLISLVWLLNVQMLQPMYNHAIKTELRQTADWVEQLVLSYDSIEDANQPNGLNADFVEAFNASPQLELLQGKCLEIANADYTCIVHIHAMAGRCELHPSVNGVFGNETLWDNQNTVMLRRSVFAAKEDMSFTLQENGDDRQQMVYGVNVDGRYTIIISTDLARISQASEVLSHQMPIIAVAVLLVSVLGVTVFAAWFTKPLHKLSEAAKAVAKGDYSVRVPVTSDDEIGALSRDFNLMAQEVGRTNELQRDLIANISHDLRTPLTLIKGYAETVRDITGDNAEKRNEQLNIIVDETDRLSGLVNSVMELSKMSSGTEKPHPVQFNLTQLCEEVAQRYDDICAKGNYTLLLDTDEVCTVTADPELLSRVIHNLLANAIHHIGADGVVELHVHNTANGVRTAIIDHGEGIRAEDLPHIFDKYYRSRSDAGKVGTGLGLSITKAILTGHGFPFGVESELGKGSTFWFVAPPVPQELPQKDVPDETQTTFVQR